LQAQTLQIRCPVSDGSFFSAPYGEFDDVPTPGGSPMLEDVPEVEPGVVPEDCVPEDCVPED
jgi:hypothetical protein